MTKNNYYNDEVEQKKRKGNLNGKDITPHFSESWLLAAFSTEMRLPQKPSFSIIKGYNAK
jgi:hypothetical protein